MPDNSVVRAFLNFSKSDSSTRVKRRLWPAEIGLGVQRSPKRDVQKSMSLSNRALCHTRARLFFAYITKRRRSATVKRMDLYFGLFEHPLVNSSLKNLTTAWFSIDLSASSQSTGSGPTVFLRRRSMASSVSSGGG